MGSNHSVSAEKMIKIEALLAIANKGVYDIANTAFIEEEATKAKNYKLMVKCIQDNVNFRIDTACVMLDLAKLTKRVKLPMVVTKFAIVDSEGKETKHQYDVYSVYRAI